MIVCSGLVGLRRVAQGFDVGVAAQPQDGDDQNQAGDHARSSVRAFQADGSPVISVDAKKKENVGNFRNGGAGWRPAGQPERVSVHDFADEELGKAVPYGIYDLTANTGWVNVSTDHDTGAFAVASIRSWWKGLGQAAYPHRSVPADHR